MTKTYIFCFKSDRNVYWGPFDDMSALVHVIAWRRTGDKPLPEPAVAKIYGTPWCQIILHVVTCINITLNSTG